MKRLFPICTILFLLSSSVFAGPVRKSLDGEWLFKQARGFNQYSGTVPGVVHTDLMDNGLIDDPFYRLNERGVQWVDKEDWIYERTFHVSGDLLAMNNITLVFEGLDTYADVFINDEKVLYADNMFRAWRVDAKPFLREGENSLRVYFHSPIKIAMPMWEATPWQYESGNDQSQNGGIGTRRVGIFVRKAGYHFGWDWGPRLVTSGIWKPVYLEAWNDARISNVHYTQKSVNDKQAVIDVVVEVVADRNITNAVVMLSNDTDNRREVSKKVSLTEGVNKIPVSFTMRKPKLWWTNGLGEQPLYDFTTTLEVTGDELDRHEQKMGIRSLRVVVEPDRFGESFYFELNGVPIFAKGANYIPCDNFLPRVTDSIYEKTIRDAVDANMNMLRIWGGGIYENEIFYDLCDQYGILVWQDFMFSCALYPSEGEFMENIRQEAIDNVRRLRNRTCLALWCGNNECLDMWFHWGVKRRYDRQNPEWSDIMWKQFTDLYYDVLPEVVAEHHPGACYRKSSPYAGDMGERSDSIGDRHYWDVWGGHKPLSQYNIERSRFFSEYGFQSFPEYSSVLRFAPEPRDWGVTSEVMMSHQRGGQSANARINKFLNEEYGEPNGFENFTYMSQLLQADAMKTAMEAHRRDMPFCMGSLVWQHNDCWPVASWSSRDWYGRWKAQHYFTVKSFADILISPIEKDGVLQVFAVSDRLRPVSGDLTVTVMDLNGRIVGEYNRRITIPANTSTVVWEMPTGGLLGDSDKNNTVAHVEFSEKAGNVYSNNYFFVSQKDMDFPVSDINIEVSRSTSGGFDVTLTSDSFVRGAFVTVDTGEDFLSDNFMDILPGRPATVNMKTELTLEEVRNKIRVISLADARK